MLMGKIFKHVTIEFRNKNYCEDIGKEDKQTALTFFNTVPTKQSSGSTVWMRGGDPHGFYYDVTQSNLNKTIKFIEANEVYRDYVHINLAFW
jgi:hypothetical protein